MATSLDTIYVGATRKAIRITIPDKNNNNVPLNLTGGAVVLKATCETLPGINLSNTGTLLDAPNGVVQWLEVGKDGSPWISTADMAGRMRVQVKLWTQYTDVNSKVDFGTPFYLDWAMPGF